MIAPQFASSRRAEASGYHVTIAGRNRGPDGAWRRPSPRSQPNLLNSAPDGATTRNLAKKHEATPGSRTWVPRCDRQLHLINSNSSSRSRPSGQSRHDRKLWPRHPAAQSAADARGSRWNFAFARAMAGRLCKARGSPLTPPPSNRALRKQRGLIREPQVKRTSAEFSSKSTFFSNLQP